MANRSTSTRSPSNGAKRAPRRRSTAASTASPSTVAALTEDAKTAVRSVRSRARRVAKKVPTDNRTLAIAAGVAAGLAAAAAAIFMNRERLRTAASNGGEKLRKAADDLSTMAHERIDQARDNITRFRGRGEEDDKRSSDNNMAANG